MRGCQARLFILGDSGLCPSPARCRGAGTQEQPAKDKPLNKRLFAAMARSLCGSDFEGQLPVMDCTFPPRSATRLRQPDQWKYSRNVRSQYHHSEHSLSPDSWGYQHSRLEPLECRDPLVQNALFTGDLDMVQKYFTKSAAINLIIETRGDVLRWTSTKRGGYAGRGRGGDSTCPGWDPKIGLRHPRKMLKGISSGGKRVVEEGLRKNSFCVRKEVSKAVEQIVAGLLKVA